MGAKVRENVDIETLEGHFRFKLRPTAKKNGNL